MEVKSKKDKNIAAILALFGGFFGLHRYYLGQVGLGIAYTVFAITFIPAFLAFIDFIVFISQSKLSFDAKYNKEHFFSMYGGKTNSGRETSRAKDRKFENAPTRYREIKGANQMFGSETTKGTPGISRREISAMKVKAIQHFKNFELKESKRIFLEILNYTPRDASIHFNLACIYSLNENSEMAFQALDQAVKYGMEGLDRITSHDALAYIRIQPQFEEFRKNNFKIPEGGFNQSTTTEAFEEPEDSIPLESREEIPEERKLERE